MYGMYYPGSIGYIISYVIIVDAGESCPLRRKHVPYKLTQRRGSMRRLEPTQSLLYFQI